LQPHQFNSTKMEGYIMKRSIISLLTIVSLSLASVQAMEEDLKPNTMQVDIVMQSVENASVFTEEKKTDKTIAINPQYTPYINILQAHTRFNNIQQPCINIKCDLPIQQEVHTIFTQSLQVLHQIKARGLDNYLACMGLAASLITQLKENNFKHLSELITLADYMQTPILINALAVICIKENIDFNLKKFPNSLAVAYIKFTYYLTRDINILNNQICFFHNKEEEEEATDKNNANMINQLFSLPTLIEDGILLINQAEKFKPNLDRHLQHYSINTITRHFNKIPNGTVKDALNECITNYTLNILNRKTKRQSEASQKSQLSYVSKELQGYSSSTLQLLDYNNQNKVTQHNNMTVDSLLDQCDNYEARQVILTAMVTWLKNLDNNKIAPYFYEQPEGYVRLAILFLYTNATSEINTIRNRLKSKQDRINLSGCFNGNNDPLFVHFIKFIELAKPLYNCNDTRLSLAKNQLTSIPAEICNLTALRKLGLSNNNLTSIPPEIGNLIALEKLWIRKNQLAEISTEIRHLTALTHLNLSHNQLTANDVPRALRDQLGNGLII